MLTDSETQRFWSKVDKTGDCWIWTGRTLTSGGYGHFYLRGRHGKTWRAHVLAKTLQEPPPDPKAWACHTCDNPPCVNPAHLYWGTPSTNGDDRHSRGRTRGFGAQYGENHSEARLTASAVRQIWQMYYVDKKSQGFLAKQFGVSQSTLHNIVAGNAWKSVTQKMRKRPRTPQKARGECHSQSALTETKVRCLWCFRLCHQWTYGQLAAELGVSKTTVAAVVTRKTWKHVPARCEVMHIL